MEKRTTYFVSRKNVLTWVAAVLMIGSVGLRIASYCGKGADTTTVWWLCVLPVAAALIYALILLLDSKEHFYRTLIPWVMFCIYFVAGLILQSNLPRYYIWLNALVLLAFLIFYKQITSGHVNRPWLLPIMFAAAVAWQAYDGKAAFVKGNAALWPDYLPDYAMLLAGLLVSFAVRPHLDGK